MAMLITHVIYLSEEFLDLLVRLFRKTGLAHLSVCDVWYSASRTCSHTLTEVSLSACETQR